MHTFRLLPVLGAMLLGSFLFSSCDKDEIPTDQPAPYKPYLPLQVGNYWVYQLFEVVDSSGGKVTPTQNFDSCYIEKDTMIGADQYFKFIHHPQGAEAVRFYKDSLRYLVDYDLGVVFNHEDVAILNQYYQMNGADTVARVALQVDTAEYVVSTPTDNHRSKLAKRTYFFVQPNHPTGQERHIKTYYSSGVGIVKETLPYNMNQYKTVERRLVRARVQ